MTITPALQRYKWWLLLAVLLLLNLIRFWPAKQASHGSLPGGPHPPDFSETPPQPDAAMLARLDALPEEQKTAIQTRMHEDQKFFASVRNLPETERREKLQQHFAQNPPPFGPPPGAGGGPPPGPGPGDGGAPHIPPPDVRRGMDQQMVNSMKNAGIQ